MTQDGRRKLLIATGNAGKVVEIRHELESAALSHDFEVIGLVDIGSPPTCDEDRPTFIGNATKKAHHYATLARCLTLADDSGLCVDALGGDPGVISARYAGVTGHDADAANNAKLMEELANIPDDRRQGKFVCAMALALPSTTLATMQDEVHGMLLRHPRGAHGFGYDPYFFFPEFQKTTAELDMATKSKISHRGKALRRMIAWIRENRGKLATLS